MSSHGKGELTASVFIAVDRCVSADEATQRFAERDVRFDGFNLYEL